MLRIFGAFLSLFCLLALVVSLDRAAQLFGGAALMLFAIDIALSSLATAPPVSRTRISNLL
jgi:hypothetical protein